MSNNLRLKAGGLLVCATLVAAAIVHTTPLHAQDANIKERLQGVDLTGLNQLKLSPNGELAARLTVLYEKESGPESLIKIWSIKSKELVQQFRFPGKAGEFAFHTDGSTIVAAATTGNLGHITTLRAWDIEKGAERSVGTCAGDIRELRFSPDGSRLAAVAALGYFDNSAKLNGVGALVSQIKVWPVNGKGSAVSIAIPHPCGEWVEMWPSNKNIDPWSGEQIQAAFLKVVPKRLQFSPDGKTLICETKAGLQTIYDSRTGVMLKHSGMASVGLFKSMLMIALHQVPADVNSLTIEITPDEKPIRMERASDGWWRADNDKQFGFKVDGEHFATLIEAVEKKDQIMTRLGLKDDTSLEKLSSLRHPLGVIEISRDETGLKFRLEKITDGTEVRETLQKGEVRWAPRVNE